MKKLVFLYISFCCTVVGLAETLSTTMPMTSPVDGYVSSEFGYRISPFTHQTAFHEGIDIAALPGTHIYSPADGRVSAIGRMAGLGRYVILTHRNGITTRYGHVKAIKVRQGQSIGRGTWIACVGRSGRTTGPHLHYEIRIHGRPVDPRKFILNLSASTVRIKHRKKTDRHRHHA